MGVVETHTDLAADLASTIGRFRRQLRRAAGTGSESRHLPESQAELLRLVARQPGISVNVAATELGLVPNTASTLVSRLVSAGLLARNIDSADRRVGRLRLTEPAQQVMDASAAARRALLSELLHGLDDSQITALAAGLEVLQTMTRTLQERTT
jgi:DNA-binding MarR family transcriptional regulator